jgi:hypothetical protein
MNELRIEHRIIRVVMVVLGIAAVGIGAMVFLMGLFFIGGVGRALSHMFVGTPHPAFIGLMVVELVAPVLVLITLHPHP